MSLMFYLAPVVLFWQANSAASPTTDNNAFESGRVVGRAIGFCGCPLILVFIIIAAAFILIKKLKNKTSQQ